MRKIGEKELSKVAGAGDIVNSGNVYQDASSHFDLTAGRDLAAFGSAIDSSTTKLIQKFMDSLNVVKP